MRALAPAITCAAVLTLLACSGPERPAPSRPRATDIDAVAPPSPASPDVESLAVPEDERAPDGRACTAASQCEDGMQCRGAPGCASDWACGAPRACLDETVSYCDCDGTTFYAAGGCPERPYAHLGACERIGELVAAGTELGLPDWDEQPTTQDRTCESSSECGRGQTCFGIAGCASEWRCVRARGCARDRVPFCGCDGETFVASSTCPGRPFVHRGECRGEAIASAEPTRDGTAAAAPDRAVARGRTRATRAVDAGATARASGNAGAVAERAQTRPDARASTAVASTATASTAARARPDAGTTAIASSAPARERTCTTSRDCARGQVCQGPAGCGMQWTCGRPERECVRDTQVFCDCEGDDFRASMFCPGRPYAHRGSCEIDRLMDLSGAAQR